MSRVRNTIGSTLLVTAVGIACAASADESVHRADSAGVAIVESRAADVPLAWTFEPRVTIGDDEDGDAAFAALHPDLVRVTGDGRIVVLDAQNHRVIVFDSTGRHLRTFGKEGGGPGELQFPNRLALDADDNAVVFDIARRELQRFALDGTVLPGIPRPEQGVITGIAFTSLGPVIAWREGGGDAANYESIALVRDTAADPIARFERPPTKMVLYESCRIGIAIGPLFAPTLTWTAHGDRVAVAGSERYVIDLYEGTRRVASVRRAVEPVRTTAEMAARELDGGMKVRWSSGECTIAPEEVIEKRGMAPTLPAVSRVALAPDGTLWVARGVVKGDTALVDIFAADGAYQGTLPKGSPMPAGFFPNGDILAVEHDELDVPRMVAYRVTRSG